jgi:hypothetical protein
MYRVGEKVRYMEPLDHDYSYGEIIELKTGRARIKKISYPPGLEVEIAYRYLDHLKGRGVPWERFM